MKETLRYLFQQKFNRDEYRRVVLQNLLHAQQLLREPQFLEETNDGDRIYGLGYLYDADGKEIGLYYTDVVNGDVRRKRVGFRQMMKPYVKYGADAAIAVFADKEHWRLSYMCDLKGGETSAKRFSYVFGDPKGQYNTPSSRLADLGRKKIVLDDLKETFSVDALSKEFFDEYHRHYDIIINELKRQGFEGATIHDYVKKMMGRIVFLHFLQKKRWLDDDPEFLKNLFFMQPLDRKADFLEQVLEPLFFGIFNTENEQREKLFNDEHWDKDLLKQWEKLPYLNGGLFERDEVDKLKIKLPASLFEDLFSFMASYNFTVDENDPDDAEVGVDPEMLGKIFESLLEDNKAKGAFYTPKEIVRYMCKESLIAYLTTQIGVDRDENIRRFVETHDFPIELAPQREIIERALREVKICDPAIGSGAFPMGLLNELWRCREAIEETASRVELKKEIIENNIYGVDIEKGAIDIARLRFWLSIVVDAEKPEPLPNFDYKFMQGNSLIESYKGFDLSRISNRLPGGQSKSTQLLLGLDSDLSRKNLQRLMRDYFSVTDHKQKASMRQSINDEVKHLIVDSIGGTASDLERLNPSANQDFFLWHTWFKDVFDKGGFDIVIGNPPYVLIDKSFFKEVYGKYYKYQEGKIDLYRLFIEKSMNLGNSKGIISMITPNTFLSIRNCKLLRKYLLNNGSFLFVDSYDDSVFKASVNSVVFSIQKGSHLDTIRICLHNVIESNKFNLDVKSIIQSEYNEININADDKAQNIRKKMLSKSVLLGDINDVEMCLGVQPYHNTIHTPEQIQSEFLHAAFQKNENYVLAYGGKHFVKYFVNGTPKRWIDYSAELYNKPDDRFFRGPRIVIRQIVSNTMICAYIDKFALFNNSVLTIKTNNRNLKLKYLLAILNSKAVGYYISSFGDKAKQALFPRVSMKMLKQIPMPFPSLDVQENISSLVDKVIKNKEENVETSIIEQEIDQQVYALYNLTPEEIAIIEQ